MMKSRVSFLQKNLKGEDCYLIDDPYDLLYFTGMHLSLGYLFVCRKKVCLFVDGRYLEVAKKICPVSTQKLSSENQLNFLKGCHTLFFNGNKMTHGVFTHFRKEFRKVGISMKSDISKINDLRVIKDASEIKKMKQSAAFAYRAYKYIKGKCRTGVMEIELARALEIYCLKNGAEKMSFEPIIAFGKNTALPHHHPGMTRLKANDIALFDLGVILDSYCSDMTRVDFFGTVDPVLKKLHRVNHGAQKAVLKLCKPGVKLKELDLAARQIMAKENMEQYFIHSLGHGIGIEVHEYPRVSKEGIDRDLQLKEGMAITIEPGLYLPGKGGVRYEDTIIITKKGYQNLYPS